MRIDPVAVKAAIVGLTLVFFLAVLCINEMNHFSILLFIQVPSIIFISIIIKSIWG